MIRLRHIAVVALLTGCEPSLEPPDVSQAAYRFTDTGFVAGDTAGPAYQAGPDPYVEGEKRLSLGIYYEGPFSDIIPIDDVNNFAYIYQSTFTSQASSESIEGLYSDEITQGSVGWWGGGLHFGQAQDFTEWTTLRLSLRSDFAEMNALELLMQSGADGGVVNAEATLMAADYGFVADGEWHHLVVPTADFAAAGVDTSAVVAGRMYVVGGGTQGTPLLIDDVYFEGDAQ